MQGYTQAQICSSSRPQSGQSQDSINALKAEFPDVKYRFLRSTCQPEVRPEGSRRSVRCLMTSLSANAAVMGVQKRTLSEDRYRECNATNHVGHWLLTCLLMPKLIKAAEGKPKERSGRGSSISLQPLQCPPVCAGVT